MNKFTFGPIISRRFGKSLGIDLSPDKKICNYDCLYCELEKAKTTDIYESAPIVSDILSDIINSLKIHPDIDVLTITANGEPTLYPYLYELIEEIDKIKGNSKTLILSNGSTISDIRVQKALKRLDIVKLSLDCATMKCLKKIDRVHKGIDIEDIKSGMLEFKQSYRGNLIIEILVVAGINDKESEFKALNEFLTTLKPTRIDIGTIDRPPAYNVKAVGYSRLYELSQILAPSLYVNMVARGRHIDITPSYYSKNEIIQTISRRPLTEDDIEILFDDKSKEILKELEEMGKITKIESNGVYFYETS